MAATAVLVLVVLALAACEGVPVGHEGGDALKDVVRGTVEGELELLVRELKAVAGELHGISDSLVITAPVSSSAVPDGVPAVPTDVALPLKPTKDTVSEVTQPHPTTPEGLPDNDQVRRRLFFIGDLADDFVREPSRVLLPPPADDIAAPAATVGTIIPVLEPSRELLAPVEEAELFGGSKTAPVHDEKVTETLNQITGAHTVSPSSVPLIHEKDADLGSLLRRPGHRLRQHVASRDQETQTAMEESDVFQGPFPVQGVRQSRSMAETKVVKPGDYVYRWSVPRE